MVTAIGRVLYAGEGQYRGNGVEFVLAPVFPLVGVIARVLLAERLFATAIRGIADALVRRNAGSAQERRRQDAANNGDYQDCFAHDSR